MNEFHSNLFAKVFNILKYVFIVRKSIYNNHNIFSKTLKIFVWKRDFQGFLIKSPKKRILFECSLWDVKNSVITLAIPFHRSSPCRFLLNRRIFRGVMVSKSRSLSTSRMTELSLKKVNVQISEWVTNVAPRFSLFLKCLYIVDLLVQK